MSAFTPDPDATVPPEEAADHEFVCRKCSEPVTYGVVKCPECGYASTGHRVLANYRILAYRMSVIGCYISIVGIPFAKYPKAWLEAWENRHAMGAAEVAE